VRGDDGLYSVEGWLPNNYVVGRGHVNHQKVNLKAFELGFVTEAYWEADHSRGIHFLPPKA